MRDIYVNALFVIGKDRFNRPAVFPWFVSTVALLAAKSKNK